MTNHYLMTERELTIFLERTFPNGKYTDISNFVQSRQP